MKKRLIYIILIVSQLSLFSCKSLVKEIDPSILPQTDSKLVVACFISPQDTIISAKVTETKVLIGSTGDIRNDIENATVKLSDGVKTVQLVYNASLGYYRILPSALPIIVGNTYSIEVNTPDGRKVSASTIVPNNVPIKEVKVDSIQSIDINQGVTVINIEYTVKVIWQDKEGEANFYRGISIFDTIIQYPNQSNTINKLPPFPSTITDLRTIDDKNSDGQLISLSRTFQPIFYGIGGSNSGIKLIKQIKVGLFQTDINYYNYHTSLRKQRENNNPFAEPVLLFTNINGGFGCFGAYNATWQDAKLK